MSTHSFPFTLQSTILCKGIGYKVLENIERMVVDLICRVVNKVRYCKFVREIVKILVKLQYVSKSSFLSKHVKRIEFVKTMKRVE